MTESEVRVSDELLLRNLKLFDGKDLTRVAILLFHPTPERYVPKYPPQILKFRYARVEFIFTI